MKKKLHNRLLFLAFFAVFFSTSIFCQKDSTTTKWHGNSWNINAQYSFSYYNELSLNIGRTKGRVDCGCVGCFYLTKTIGLGVSKLFEIKDEVYLYKGYVELGMFSMFPILFRAEYNYIPSYKQSIIKPEIGFTFLYFDISYSYGINLNPKLINPIQHGLNLRLKFYYKQRNWPVRNHNRRKFQED